MLPTSAPELHLRAATEDDVSLLLELVRQLAAYDKLAPEVVATEASLRDVLFRGRRVAEDVIAECSGQPVGFALFSTIFPPASASRASPSRIFLSRRNTAAEALERPC